LGTCGNGRWLTCCTSPPLLDEELLTDEDDEDEDDDDDDEEEEAAELTAALLLLECATDEEDEEAEDTAALMLDTDVDDTDEPLVLVRVAVTSGVVPLELLRGGVESGSVLSTTTGSLHAATNANPSDVKATWYGWRVPFIPTLSDGDATGCPG